MRSTSKRGLSTETRGGLDLDATRDVFKKLMQSQELKRTEQLRKSSELRETMKLKRMRDYERVRQMNQPKS